MLKQLHIRHLLLLEDCQLEFSPTLNALSGESGSGKSLMLQAVALSVGARFDHDLLSPGRKGGSVTARWQLAPDHPVWAALAERGVEMEPDEDLVIRRQFGQPSGMYVNDVPVALKTMNALAPLLLEIYGQFSAHRLAEADYQRHIVDDFAGLTPLVDRVSQGYCRWQDTARALREVCETAARLEERADYVSHVLDELRQENVAEDEWPQLEQQRHEARQHSYRLTQINTVLTMMQQAGLSRQIDQFQLALGETGDDRLTPVIEGLERAGIEIAEAERTLVQQQYTEQQSEWDLDAIEQRLFRFSELARKHRVAPDKLLEVKRELEQEAQATVQSRDEITRLQRQHDKLETEVMALCQKLRQQRQQAAAAFSRAINTEFPNLNMPDARVDIRVLSLETPTAFGQDRVQFLLRTQPDAEVRPLLKVASGGELSRVLLAIALGLGWGKSSSLSGIGLVLDEVDAGMGGETAAILGGRLKFLGARRQVIAVTHSPQVAAQADQHFGIHKQHVGDRVTSSAGLLESAARREEIARMLAGETITDAARQAADALLG